MWLVTSGEYAHSYIHSLWIHFIFPLHISEFASNRHTAGVLEWVGKAGLQSGSSEGRLGQGIM